jgi:hypothetical protein
MLKLTAAPDAVVALVVAVVSAVASAAAAAQALPPANASPAPAATTPAWVELVPLPIVPQGLPVAAMELCRDKPGGLAWIDRMQAGLYRSMCLTAARFDGMFGNARLHDQYEQSYGSISVGTLWDERDNWDPTLRFRVNLRLPQMNESLRAFVGRLDPDEFITELRDDFETLPRQFSQTDDDAVLLGLGYRQPGPGGGHLDASVGARFGWPLEPYLKGSYRITQPVLERNLVRFDQTVFWREDDGPGTTTRLDLERLLTTSFLVRWSGAATFAQNTEGLRWLSTVTLYHSLGDGRALAYQAGASGETDAEVGTRDYGLRLIYRRRIHLDWLFLELRSGVTWPRELRSERREPNWGAGFALEMQFGERPRAGAER